MYILATYTAVLQLRKELAQKATLMEVWIVANYELNLAHLYGNLLNTYGDNGNLLTLNYYAKQMGIELHSEIVSIYQDFDPDKYDFVFIGGGQDYEQVIVSKDIQDKKKI